MAEEDKSDDDEVDLFQERELQLVTSKKRKNKKALAIDYYVR